MKQDREDLAKKQAITDESKRYEIEIRMENRKRRQYTQKGRTTKEFNITNLNAVDIFLYSGK